MTSYNGQAIRYDASGNPTTYRGYTMTWQGRRLTGATGSGNTLTYSYDENGLRTQKTVNGTATQYRYHGSVLISQVTGSNKLLFSYDANGNVVAVNYNGTYYYYVRNGQNDVIRLIDGNNNSVVEYSYDSWGRQISCTGSLARTLGTQNPFRYRGYVYDTETGLYYLQSRYYDPAVDRFINADIYVSTGQGLLGHNMYAYCLNNPVVHLDDMGMWTLSIFLGPNATIIFGGGSIGIGISIDDNGNIGIQWTYSAPNGLNENKTYHAGLIDAGIGGNILYTSVDTIYDLEGPGCSFGFSVGGGPYGGVDAIFAGAEMQDSHGIEYPNGAQFSLGYGAGIDAHMMQTQTYTLWSNNRKSIAGGLIRERFGDRTVQKVSRFTRQ